MSCYLFSQRLLALQACESRRPRNLTVLLVLRIALSWGLSPGPLKKETWAWRVQTWVSAHVSPKPWPLECVSVCVRAFLSSLLSSVPVRVSPSPVK